MNHLLILPLLLPLFAGSLLLMSGQLALRWQRRFSCLATFLLIPVAVLLVQKADSGVLFSYALGNWAAP